MIDLKVTNAMFELLRTVFDAERELSRESAEILKANLSAIYEISKRNDMAHLIGFALEKQGLISPEGETFAKFQKQQYLAMYRCEGMEYEIARMRETFESGGIDFIMLKGSVIRGLYPESWMRTSSDIDVLVRAEDHARAEDLLIRELAYTKGVEGTHDHSLHSEGGVHVELHFTLIDDERANSAREMLEKVWEYATAVCGKKHEYELKGEMFYLYHISHLAKHVEYAGSGIRPFIDLWLINQNMQRDKKASEELLSSCSLVKFASFCDELSEYWMSGSGTLSETGKRLENFVLNCGIYGSEENRIAIHQRGGKSKFKYIWRRLFYPYSELKNIYPILQKHKWLTPFCQMRRWLKLITGEKTVKVIKEIETLNNVTDEDINAIGEFMCELGLETKNDRE